MGLPADIFTDHGEGDGLWAVVALDSRCRLLLLLVGDAVDEGELAVDDVVVVLGDDTEKSDWEEEDNFSTSSRNSAASSSVPSMLVAMVE